MAIANDSNLQDGTQAKFPSQTNWTQIVAAGGPSASPETREALNQLCRIYWFPLYAFIRRAGYDCHKAKDLTQGFFEHLLETDLIMKASREKGRFRSFLLASLTNFLEDERRRGIAQKRGRDFSMVSIDEIEAEEKYEHLPSREADAAMVFDRTWAATVIEQVHQSLRREYIDKERLDVYEAVKGSLTGDLSPDSYAEVAARLGMTKQTLEVNLSRFRRSFGEWVRTIIAQTVADPAEIDDEIRYLMAAWAGYLEQKQGEPSGSG